jgi:hypothetical protein
MTFSSRVRYGIRWKALENKSKELPTKIGPLLRIKTIDVDAVHGQCVPVVGCIHGAEDGKQGGFSGPRLPHDADELPAADGRNSGRTGHGPSRAAPAV